MVRKLLSPSRCGLERFIVVRKHWYPLGVCASGLLITGNRTPCPPFAAESPLPDPAELLTDVYVDYPMSALWPFQEAAVAVRR
ncbi:hypothetical protein [Chloroflexus sp.]|uniref:hypothetical protein n=1 Tax=Chloroflexus sp. TaxID=1904827 RepID=UPI00404A0721